MSAVSENDGFVDISPSGRPEFAAAGPRVVFEERIGLARGSHRLQHSADDLLTTPAEVDVPRSRR